MEYKVVPFTVALNQQQHGASIVANELENLISQYVKDGWQYIRLEDFSKYIPADTGCFGLGAKPGFTVSYQMVVFSRK